MKEIYKCQSKESGTAVLVSDVSPLLLLMHINCVEGWRTCVKTNMNVFSFVSRWIVRK